MSRALSDLSLTGSQVPSRTKLRQQNLRSSKIYGNSGDGVKDLRESNKKHIDPEKSKPSLAMSFPSKSKSSKNSRSKSSTPRSSMTSRSEVATDDDLSSFFSQRSTKSRHKKHAKPKDSKNPERVFEIPDSARSDHSVRSSMAEYTLEKESDVDFLKSYMNNMDNERSTDGLSHFDDIDSQMSNRSITISTTKNDKAFTTDVDVDPYDNLSKDIGFTEEILESNNFEETELYHSSSYTKPDIDDDLEEKIDQFRRDRSARKIQAFYRRHNIRKKTSEAALKRMLQQKKEDMENQILSESFSRRERSEEEKKKQREMRAREARKQAIRDLETKRNAQKERETKMVKKSPPATSVIETSELSATQVDGPVIPLSEVSTTTLDDVLATIKQLEEEPEQLRKTKQDFRSKLSWIDDLESQCQSNVSSKVSTVKPPQAESSTFETEAKLHSLISYLDEADKRSDTKSIDHEQTMKKIVQAEKTATEVTSEMLKIRLELEEKTKSVNLLQKALAHQREITSRQSNDQEKEMNERSKLQKEHYEATIQRHLTFIDQLIDDKKVLHEKCEKLVTEIKQMETKYQSKIKQISGSNQAEMKKAKDLIVASEKVKREKWIEEKTKKIKEMTVKGLEPEIQRLINKHKEEVRKIKAIHEAELLQSDERAGQRYVRQTEQLREQLEREKEAACSREREMARQRYEKQLEAEEIALQQQRKRLYAEVAEEKERINQQAIKQRGDIDEIKSRLADDNRLKSEALHDEFESNVRATSERHREELRTLQEKMEVEKEVWQENFMKKQESFMAQKERQLKEAVRRDRDSEIDVVIQRLEEDMHRQQIEQDKTTENRLKRIREKYESEMKEVERSEKQTQEKYLAMKEEFNEIESENLRLQSLSKQKEQEVLDIVKFKDKLVEERGRVSDVIRQEFADRLVITEDENKRMKNELSELRARHRLEMDQIKQEKDDELTQVNKRVRHAIIKKEETISLMRTEHEAAVKRADHLEGLLEAQRNKVLAKNTKRR